MQIGDNHFTLNQLNLLYSRLSPDTQEYLSERVGIEIFDGGLTALEAANLAHLETTAWLGRRALSMADDGWELKRQIQATEERIRAMGYNPNIRYRLDKNGIK